MALSECFRVQTAKHSLSRAGFGIGAPLCCLFSESVSFSMCEMCCGLHRGVVKMNEQMYISNSDQDQGWVSAAYTSNSFQLSSSLYPKLPRTEERRELSRMALSMP